MADPNLFWFLLGAILFFLIVRSEFRKDSKIAREVGEEAARRREINITTTKRVRSPKREKLYDLIRNLDEEVGEDDEKAS